MSEIRKIVLGASPDLTGVEVKELRWVGVLLHEKEYADLVAAAELAGLVLSEYIRRCFRLHALEQEIRETLPEVSDEY